VSADVWSVLRSGFEYQDSIEWRVEPGLKSGELPSLEVITNSEGSTGCQVSLTGDEVAELGRVFTAVARDVKKWEEKHERDHQAVKS
jgi:hypothetical protein